MPTRVRQDRFDPRRGLDRGRSRAVEALWYACKAVFFLSACPWPSALRVWLLRCFGAQVGRGVRLKPRINIHLPWKLSVGDHAWIGEEVFILNFEPVTIGAHACISQRAFLCTGNHDFRDVTMPYRNRPIVIGDGTWIGAQVLVAPGVTVGDEAVVTAGSVVTRSLPPAMVCTGHPCVPVAPRWRDTAG
ncbi:MAG: WcaF family extracellular polysaccharide biosynthesis acetyltransferase [Verrucomicrobiota bacterium]